MIKMPKMPSISPEKSAQIKQTLKKTKDVTLTVAKYGSVFSGGVLMGTIAGFCLFFYIENKL